MRPTNRKLLSRLAPLACVLCLAPAARAGDPPPPSPVAGAASDATPYTAAELEEIVGPIALYPDIVVSSILPASTAPSDVVEAAQWLATQSGTIAGAPEGSAWDGSVQAMVQFPDVLKWMSENLPWMEQLAYAVSVQQAEVLAAIQDFREKCKDAGNLQSNDKVTVVNEGDVITIQPAQPSVVYVPTYDPVAVAQPGYTWPTFWAGFAAGAVGAWAWHSIAWGNNGGYGSIDVNRSAEFNFTNNGNINTGNIGSGNRWNSSTNNVRQPTRTAAQSRPKSANYANAGAGAKPGPGGVKPGAKPPSRNPGSAQRPGGAPNRPAGGASTLPAGGAGNRPGATPSRPSTMPANKPSAKPAAKPATRPTSSAGSRDSFAGSSTSGRSAKAESSRGRSSTSSGGGSRGGGGGSRGGGGGGGRRR